MKMNFVGPIYSTFSSNYEAVRSNPNQLFFRGNRCCNFHFYYIKTAKRKEGKHCGQRDIVQDFKNLI